VRRLENQSFLLLLVAVTLAFAWILAPYYGAILWAIAAAFIFAPLNRKLQSSVGRRPNLAAAATVLIVIAMVILPLALITASLLQEASGFYAKVESGEYNFAAYIQRVFDALPAWATVVLDRFNLTSLSAVLDSLKAGLVKGDRRWRRRRSASA
jgi:predicted PurR-regulated permease PerM